MWDLVLKRAEDGFVVVDRPPAAPPAGRRSTASGPVRGWAYFRHAHEAGKDLLRVAELFYEDVPALLRLLHFFASLRDQYAAAVLPLPADVPLNRLLRETQLPHRPVNHATAECRPYTRMQVRVLDSKRLIESMRLPPQFRGAASVVVHETPEGDRRRGPGHADAAGTGRRPGQVTPGGGAGGAGRRRRPRVRVPRHDLGGRRLRRPAGHRRRAAGLRRTAEPPRTSWTPSRTGRRRSAGSISERCGRVVAGRGLVRALDPRIRAAINRGPGVEGTILKRFATQYTATLFPLPVPRPPPDEGRVRVFSCSIPTVEMRSPPTSGGAGGPGEGVSLQGPRAGGSRGYTERLSHEPRKHRASGSKSRDEMALWDSL